MTIVSLDRCPLWDRGQMRSAGRNLMLVVALPACAFAAGCTTCNQVSTWGDFDATPGGQCAVAVVQARDAETPRMSLIVFGSIDTPNAAERFKDCLAHIAREEAKLDMTSALDREVTYRQGVVARRPDEPDPAAERMATRYGLACYLTADVQHWRSRYFLFFFTSTIEYRLTCRRPGDPIPVWRAQVRREKHWASDLEVATLALRETFEWLRR